MVVMGKKFLMGGAFMPAGLIATTGVIMDLFYVHNMATGRAATRRGPGGGCTPGSYTRPLFS
jgi:hypothetical protein